MIYHETQYKGYDIEIHLDEQPEDPREWDNLGVMICSCRKYNLGDDQDWILHDFEFNYGLELNDIKEIENSENVIALPLYLYDHSGITMNTTGFSCGWDSGKVGFIFVEKKKAMDYFGWNKLDEEKTNQILETLKSEVEVYDQYLQNNVFGFTLKKDGETVDSLWGIYGLDEAVDMAKRSVERELIEII